jgi:hypothetical protein
MKKINFKNPYIIAGGIAVVAVISYFMYNSWKKKKIMSELTVTGAASTTKVPASSAGSTSKTETGGVLITNHDTTWDYLYENGQWYTRKKGATSWINMKENLSTDNYNLAVSRLQKYI